MYWKTGIGIILALAATLCSCATAGNQALRTGFGGMLIRALLEPSREPFRVADLNPAAYASLPDSLKARLAVWETRATGFRSRLSPPGSVAGIAEGPEVRAIYETRQALERAIFILSDDPDIGDAAADYVIRAKIYSDWQGVSIPPLAEAVYAERFTEDPALRPALLLFLLHRYRCAYEALIKEGEIIPTREYRDKYRETLRLAREHPDPLVGLVADDFDAVPGNVSIPPRFTGGPVHPRENAPE